MSVKSLADPTASLKLVANGRDGYIQANDGMPAEPEYDDSLIHKVSLFRVLNKSHFYEIRDTDCRRLNCVISISPCGRVRIVGAMLSLARGQGVWMAIIRLVIAENANALNKMWAK